MQSNESSFCMITNADAASKAAFTQRLSVIEAAGSPYFLSSFFMSSLHEAMVANMTR